MLPLLANSRIRMQCCATAKYFLLSALSFWSHHSQQEMLPGQEQSEDQSDSDENKDYDDGDDDDDDDEEDREADGGEAKDEQQKQPPQMRLPTATERWVMEAAPTRDQQQARQAHEVWTQLQANLGLLSLSSSLAS